MVEEADLQIGAQLAEVAGNHPQVVIVDPYHGIGCGFLRGFLCEDAVHFQVVRPMFVVELGFLHKSEYGGPEGFF